MTFLYLLLLLFENKITTRNAYQVVHPTRSSQLISNWQVYEFNPVHSIRFIKKVAKKVITDSLKANESPIGCLI